jgi:hypothetical protein
VAWIEPSGERYAQYKEITTEIDFFLKTIEEDSGLSSSHTIIINHEYFKKLVEMGDKIIPYLFHVMVEHGASWTILILLRHLTQENPIKPEHVGKFYHIFHDWLGWYLDSPYDKNDDIYHGLVTK